MPVEPHRSLQPPDISTALKVAGVLAVPFVALALVPALSGCDLPKPVSADPGPTGTTTRNVGPVSPEEGTPEPDRVEPCAGMDDPNCTGGTPTAPKPTETPPRLTATREPTKTPTRPRPADTTKPTETPRFTATGEPTRTPTRPRPTDTRVPPTATTRPTDVPQPTPTEKPAPGDQDIGTEFRLKSEEMVLEQLNKPENKNKIILPGKPNDKSLVVYPSLQPYRSSGISYTPLSLLITETDDSNIIIPTANRTFGVSKTNKGNGIIAIDDFNGKKLKVDGLGEIEIANVMVFFGVDPQHSFNYETFDLSKFGFGDPIYQHSVPYQWFIEGIRAPKAVINVRVTLKGHVVLTEQQVKDFYKKILFFTESGRLVSLK